MTSSTSHSLVRNIAINSKHVGSIRWIGDTPYVESSIADADTIDLSECDDDIIYEVVDLTLAKYLVFTNDHAYYAGKTYYVEDVPNELQYVVMLIADRFYITNGHEDLVRIGYAKEVSERLFDVVNLSDQLTDTIGFGYKDGILKLMGDREVECEAFFRDNVLHVTKLHEPVPTLDIEDLPYTYTEQSMVNKQKEVQMKLMDAIQSRLISMKNMLHAIADTINDPHHLKLYSDIVYLANEV